MHPTENRQARGVSGAAVDPAAAAQEEAALREVEAVLLARGGESNTMSRALRHVVTRITDEGLVIELFDLDDAPLFEADTTTPAPVLRALIDMVAEVATLVTNPVAVQGHVRAYPAPLRDNPVWALSAGRAEAVRLMLQGGLDPGRVVRVTGYADRRPASTDPTAARNNRIELVLLRRDR
jgi:chemotaxis protein MotB